MLTLPFAPHPVIAAPSEAAVLALVERLGSRAPEELRRIEQERLDLMAKMESNRFEYGYVLPNWKLAEADMLDPACSLLVIFGGGGAAKTVFSVWHAVRQMVARPDFKVLFLHVSERSSIEVHQTFIFQYLPVEWRPSEERKIKRGLTTKVNYSKADGFTNNVFVLPNGSFARFAFYGQQVGEFEGGGWDLVVADEDLPLGWFKTLYHRLARRGGKFLWTFSPIDGITPAIKHIVTGARTLEHRRAPLLGPDHRTSDLQDWPPGHMPVLQETTLTGGRIRYFFSEDNPWAGYEQHAQRCLADGVLATERRAYGYARNTQRANFPLFGAANILPPEKIPTSGVTRYLIKDPAGARNSFMIWVAVDGHGRHFVYREWPDWETYGEWAEAAEESKRWDGKPGPAQESLGFGIIDYKRTILEAEGWRWDLDAGTYVAARKQEAGTQEPRNGEADAVPGFLASCLSSPEEIFARYIDPRAGSAQSIADDQGGSAIMDRFAEEQLDHQGRVIGPAMDFIPAPGLHEKEGLAAINNLLAWNPTQPFTHLLNEPKLYLAATCQNTIWALQNYTGHDGEKAACKDPIDCLRYAATADLAHIEASQLASHGGGSY